MIQIFYSPFAAGLNQPNWLFVSSTYLIYLGGSTPTVYNTRAHHRDEIPERDVTYHVTCLLIYH